MLLRLVLVFQSYQLIGNLSALENVMLPMEYAKVPKAARQARASELLEHVGITGDMQDRRPGRLSGGEQQRLCIARALAVEPDVLLMDEPTSSLDPISTQRIEDLMQDLKKIVTIVIVTHNMQQAARVSDDCAFLLMAEDRAGELIEFAPTAKIFNDPQDSRTLDYIQGRFG